jgi:hypothetical protein
LPRERAYALPAPIGIRLRDERPDRAIVSHQPIVVDGRAAVNR